MKKIKLYQLLTIACVVLIKGEARSQSIYTALHLNEDREYIAARPQKIVESNIFYTINGKEKKKSVKSFDKAGMLLTEERFDENDELTERLTYTNDTINRLKLSRTFERWTKTIGLTKQTSEYVYDNQHFLVGVLDKNAAGNIFEKFEIVNNERGDPITLSGYSFNGALIGRETATYMYDENKCNISVLNADGTALSSNTSAIKFKKDNKSIDNDNVADDKGNIVSWTTVDITGKQTHYSSEFVYDKKGNCTTERIYKVTIKANGRQKREIDREFKKEYIYAVE